MKFIVKLFAEITIKSDSVRRKMVRQLYHNLHTILDEDAPGSWITRHWDRLEVAPAPGREAAIRAILTQTPGIAHVLEAEEIVYDGMADLVEKVAPHYAGAIAGKRFRCSTQRSGKTDFTSIDFDRALGARLLELSPTAKVDLGGGTEFQQACAQGAVEVDRGEVGLATALSAAAKALAGDRPGIMRGHLLHQVRHAVVDDLLGLQYVGNAGGLGEDGADRGLAAGGRRHLQPVPVAGDPRAWRVLVQYGVQVVVELAHHLAAHAVALDGDFGEEFDDEFHERSGCESGGHSNPEPVVGLRPV